MRNPCNLWLLLLLSPRQRTRISFSTLPCEPFGNSMFRIVERVAMLQHGAIVFSGTPEEIMTCNTSAVREFVDGSIPKDGLQFGVRDAGAPA